MPAELQFALAMNVEGLRPWEFWQMDSEEHHMILELQQAWREELESERAALVGQDE